MKVQILGCSGGIGGDMRTTSLLVDGHTLIDAGTGVGDLSLRELADIDRVFLTHSHLDHLAMLPLMLDSVGAMRSQPLTVYALPQTLDVLRNHVFNWALWPDFTQIPSAASPYLRLESIAVGDVCVLPGDVRLTVLPAEHTVPAVGYALTGACGQLVFTGDTYCNPALWPLLNAMPALKILIIETAFPNRERFLADAAKHLCPSLLASELAQLQGMPEIYITHLKPGDYERTMQEVLDNAARFSPKMLLQGQCFEL